ncbi:MAG: hypothetical protein WDN27_00085 [Candidatus Saccharibacteria bacterium]
MTQQRLPVPGSDNGTWGDILNGFLSQSHNGDGTLQDGIITDANISGSAAISKAKLASAVQTSLATADSSVQQVNGKSPTSGAVTLAAGDVGAAPLPSGTATNGQVPVVTGTSPLAMGWAAAGTVDTTHTPLAPSSSPSPGTGSNGVSASDHVHPLPTLASLSTLGVLTTSTAPLYMGISTGNITLPRGHQDDSQNYGSTPASATIHYTYFITQQAGSVGHIRFQTGSTAQATNTYTNVGLYTVNTSTGALTLATSATSQQALSGTYAGQTFAMGTPYTVSAGTLYAVGLLQKATTPASLLGAWFNGVFLGATQQLAMTGGTGLSALPSTASAPVNNHNFPVYYELYP